MHDLGGTGHGVRAPFLHAGAVDVLAGMVEGDPRERLLAGDLRALHQLEGARGIVKGDREDGSRRRPASPSEAFGGPLLGVPAVFVDLPRADHQMVFHLGLSPGYLGSDGVESCCAFLHSLGNLQPEFDDEA